MINRDLVFANWTLELIRKNSMALAWLEERRFDWCSIAYRFVNNIIDGYSVILCTDIQRKWFARYILQNINLNKGRPLIPIFSINNILPNGYDINTNLIEDMLEVAFKNYIIWYIGNTNHNLSKLSIESQNSFIWAFDSNLHTAFNLNSNDYDKDIKLLQLFSVLDRTIDAIMFNEIEIK
ncbi:MAG: HobA family DNA replication regulator [Helicobacteraceae bacterium]|nr:HobA family DNA replication regulator [Helicobacteraceae bacterium]